MAALLHQPQFSLPRVIPCIDHCFRSIVFLFVLPPFRNNMAPSSLCCVLPARYHHAGCFLTCYLTELLQYSHEVLRALWRLLGAIQIIFKLFRRPFKIPMQYTSWQPTCLSLFLIVQCQLGWCSIFLLQVFSWTEHPPFSSAHIQVFNFFKATPRSPLPEGHF